MASQHTRSPGGMNVFMCPVCGATEESEFAPEGWFSVARRDYALPSGMRRFLLVCSPECLYVQVGRMLAKRGLHR